jgi:hypothetical protein
VLVCMLATHTSLPQESSWQGCLTNHSTSAIIMNDLKFSVTKHTEAAEVNIGIWVNCINRTQQWQLLVFLPRWCLFCCCLLCLLYPPLRCILLHT